MAHLALKRYSYVGQFGVLAGFVGGGLILAAIASIIPVLMHPNLKDLLEGNSKELMKKLLVPENANMLRIVQFISTFLLFFLPTWVYARVCHRNAMAHLGFKNGVSLPQFVITILIMAFSLPISGMLGELTEMLPFSEATMQKFRGLEEDYAKQVSVIGRMDNFGDFLISLFMLAILPAVFEETLFRGGMQNLLSRWLKMPVLAIIITSIVFSAVHFSYLGFLSRFALSFVLGWMYFRTGNIWLNIIGHVTNNAVGLTVLYLSKLNNPDADLNTADPGFPIWLGLAGVIIVVALFVAFERVSRHQINAPGKEVLMADEMNNPFT